MSVNRKRPFIESRINELSESQLETLIHIINTREDTEQRLSLVENEYSLRSYIGNETELIEAIVLQFEKGRQERNGYLIYNGTHCTFIAYFSYQDLDLYDIDLSDLTYKHIKEHCTIEELRRVIAICSLRNGLISIAPQQTRVYRHNIRLISQNNLVELSIESLIESKFNSERILDMLNQPRLCFYNPISSKIPYVIYNDDGILILKDLLNIEEPKMFVLEVSTDDVECLI